MEVSHSGLVRTLGKRVYRKVSGVRIPSPPPHASLQATFHLFSLRKKPFHFA
jgi:hypothetical protein